MNAVHSEFQTDRFSRTIKIFKTLLPLYLGRRKYGKSIVVTLMTQSIIRIMVLIPVLLVKVDSLIYSFFAIATANA